MRQDTAMAAMAVAFVELVSLPGAVVIEFYI
jgi:hypothetical protein